MSEPRRAAVIGPGPMGFGMGKEDDASLARLYAQPSGAKLPEKT